MTTVTEAPTRRERLEAAVRKCLTRAEWLLRQAERDERYAVEALRADPPMPDAARLHESCARQARLERLAVLDLADDYRDRLAEAQG